MKALLRLLAAAGLLLYAAATHAVFPGCSVAAVSLVFGNYNPFSLGHTDSTGNIAVTCSGISGQAVAYRISLNAGVGGSFAPRRLRSGSTLAIDYNIYANAARSVVWGDGSAGTLVVSDSFSLPAPSVTKHYTVYGRLFARQNVPPGPYSASIVVTLEY